MDEGKTRMICQAQIPWHVDRLIPTQFTQQYPQLADLDKVGIIERRRIVTE
jgi:hypothetical protein